MGQASAAPGAAGRREAAAKLATLTERELDVACLVAQGLPNPEIAQQLFLGEATVKTRRRHGEARRTSASRPSGASVTVASGFKPQG